MTVEFSRQTVEKSVNIKLHQNPSSGSRVVPCGRTDVTKLIVIFRNFVSAPNKLLCLETSVLADICPPLIPFRLKSLGRNQFPEHCMCGSVIKTNLVWVLSLAERWVGSFFLFRDDAIVSQV